MSCADKCSVCLEELKLPLGMLCECKHIFCYDCIKRWSGTRRKCPLDRTPFDTIGILHRIGGPVVEEEKLGHQLVDRLEGVFEDDTDESDDEVDRFFALIADTSQSRLSARYYMGFISPYHICHRCYRGISHGTMTRCRGCERPYHMQCLIESERSNSSFLCPACHQRRGTPFWRTIFRSIRSFFTNPFRRVRRR
ncbi:unnamed protein product [Rodentolepis nana]|uniref:RING-type domain-containing protein n=1 Tax=Rodentolepis nana TaxID=102285 RepID=A0A0R3TEG2_RODNA|nr:unnamed protein product [Rodentolepis nana]VDO14948.1 unnamed protein product [Rodentolepis nana]